MIDGAKPQVDREGLKRMVEEIVKPLLGNQFFTTRKLTDTPTDDLMVVNRKYVNLNGTTAQRPVSSIIGQQYFDTTLGYPIYRNQNYHWCNSVGSVVG